ncbi:ATP-dependent nuclease [Geodermatophilus amargosae]|uniref:ATP-dependent nuclease n=1 Tax=Geodermatophilus amargosae TaxID=1296565 RepID=UPI0034DE3244
MQRGSFPANVEISHLSPLTILCGNNGTGKSSLLALMAATLWGSRDHLPAHLHEGTAILRTATPKEAAQLSIDLADGLVAGGPPSFTETIMVDASSDARASRQALSFEENLAEYVEQFGAREFPSGQLELIRYVTRKDYRRVAVYELERRSENPEEAVSEEALSETTPYFVIETPDGVAYDSLSMGLGELAALTLLWRLFQAPPGSLLLIEEPEAHVSPASQAALLNVIARVASERSLTSIVSTHSVEMLQKVPVSAVRVLEVMGIDVNVRAPRNLEEARVLLGLPARPAALVIVEDRLAQVVLHELLSLSGELAGLGVQISWAGSVENVKRAVDSCNSLSPRQPAVGVLDGDQRNLGGTRLCLPGDTSPEEELMAALASKPRLASRTLGRADSEIRTALSSVAGQDPHEAWHELVQRLALNSESLARLSVRVWLTTPGVRGALRTLIAGIRREIG